MTNFVNFENACIKLGKLLGLEFEGSVIDENYCKHYFFDKSHDIQVEFINEKIFIMKNDDENTKIFVQPYDQSYNEIERAYKKYFK